MLWIDVSEAREIGATPKALRLAFGSSMSGGYVHKIWVPRSLLRDGNFEDAGTRYMAGWFYFKHQLWKFL